MKPSKKQHPKDTVPIWTTKEGREIPVPLLEDSHLLNCICMLYRNAISALERFNTDWNEMYTFEEVVHSQYIVLTAEASRRGLDWQERVSKLNPATQYLEMFL